MKAKTLRALVLGLVLQTSLVASAKSVEHVFREGDTLWFVSQIYYGDGKLYTKLMQANGLESDGRLRSGQKLQVPNPLYTPDQPGWDLRLTHLREKRAELLAKRGVASDEYKVVVLPTGPTTGPRDSLPANEVKEAGPSVQEKAKAELGGK